MKMKSTAALAATQIRQLLKKEFPGTKFSVKSQNFAGGNAVDVSWEDGVSWEKVEKLISVYEYGSFNCENDMYEDNNYIEGLPQVKYISIDRSISDKVLLEKFKEYKKRWSFLENVETLTEESKEIFEKCNCWTAKGFILRSLKNFKAIDIA